MNHDLELPLPFERLEQMETAISRLRYVIIAVLIAMIAGYAVLGVVVWQMIGRIDQLATKANGIDATLGVRFGETNTKLDATNAKLDTISGRIAAEFKTMETEIKAMETEIKAMEAQMTAQIGATTKSVAIPPSAPVQTKPAPVTKQPAPPPPPTRRRP